MLLSANCRRGCTSFVLVPGGKRRCGSLPIAQGFDHSDDLLGGPSASWCGHGGDEIDTLVTWSKLNSHKWIAKLYDGLVLLSERTSLAPRCSFMW